MPKQSVKKGNSGFYQPAKYKTRELNYRRQLLKQIGRDFKPFEHFVEVQRLEFIFAPTKQDLKRKGSRRWLEFGGLIPKYTIPDLPDNLPKFFFDCISRNPKLPRHAYIIDNDARVQAEQNVFKWYGMKPRIEIDLIGY